MNWLTSPDEPSIHLELRHGELRHVIAALIFCTQDENMDLEQIETNDRMIGLLLQLEQDMVREMNADQFEEGWVRENGEA